jgi:hypothetical protein
MSGRGGKKGLASPGTTNLSCRHRVGDNTSRRPTPSASVSSCAAAAVLPFAAAKPVAASVVMSPVVAPSVLVTVPVAALSAAPSVLSAAAPAAASYHFFAAEDTALIISALRQTGTSGRICGAQDPRAPRTAGGDTAG